MTYPPPSQASPGPPVAKKMGLFGQIFWSVYLAVLAALVTAWALAAVFLDLTLTTSP